MTSQLLVPGSIAYQGAWAGAVTAINESTEDRTAYVSSELAPASSVIVVALTAGIAPASTSGNVINYGYRKRVPGSTSKRVDLTVELRQSWVSEPSNLGTLIATYSHTDIQDWTDAVQTLTAPQVTAITLWNSLFLRFIANQP